MRDEQQRLLAAPGNRSQNIAPIALHILQMALNFSLATEFGNISTNGSLAVTPSIKRK